MIFYQRKLLLVVPCACLFLTSFRGAFSGSLKLFGLWICNTCRFFIQTSLTPGHCLPMLSNAIEVCSSASPSSHGSAYVILQYFEMLPCVNLLWILHWEYCFWHFCLRTSVYARLFQFRRISLSRVHFLHAVAKLSFLNLHWLCSRSFIGCWRSFEPAQSLVFSQISLNFV